MCVQSQLLEQGDRITALEGQHHTTEDYVSLQADITRINTYLFGASGVPDEPRDKSGLKAVKS